MHPPVVKIHLGRTSRMCTWQSSEKLRALLMFCYDRKLLSQLLQIYRQETNLQEIFVIPTHMKKIKSKYNLQSTKVHRLPHIYFKHNFYIKLLNLYIHTR